jgi:VIT1/CCC1 family predicted Fe2+/Mn2+ transporter
MWLWAGRILALLGGPRGARTPGYDPAMADSRDTAAGRRARFLRRGSVPLFAHGMFEYLIGILAIAAPFLFSFDHNGAIAFSVLMGAAILVLGGLTDGPTGIVRNLPVASHIVLDVVVGVVLVVAPFVFGFTEDEAATAFMVVLGLVFLLLAYLTRYHAGGRE